MAAAVRSTVKAFTHTKESTVAGKKFIVLDITTGKLKQFAGTDQSTGATNAGDIVALDSTGKLDPSLLPSSGGEAAHAIVCSEALAVGDWINIYNNGGTRAVRRALATDATKPAHGFVKTAYTAGQTANVYVDGTNSNVATTGFVASDIGQKAFLSSTTSGGATKTCPQVSGNLVQVIGHVVDVTGGAVSIELDFGEQIIF